MANFFFFLNSYNEAIEMTKDHSDYLWLASAKEGLACTMLLMAFLQADVGVTKKKNKETKLGS